MQYITILFLLYIFLKTWYYGIYELKTNKNKTAAISIFFMAIVRSSILYYNCCIGFLVFCKYLIINDITTAIKPETNIINDNFPKA